MIELFLAWIAVAAPAVSPQEETVFVEEAPGDFLQTLRRHEEARNWKALFEYAGGFLQRDTVPLVKLPDEPDRWIGADEYLLLRLSRLPVEARQAYRAEVDAPARLAMERAREEGDRVGLERALGRYFFSTPAETFADILAQEACDGGRPAEAIRRWDRRLRYGTTDGPARCVVAARLANACVQAGDEVSLERLRQYVAGEKLDGDLRVGGRSRSLAEYLAGLKLSPGPSSAAEPPDPSSLCVRSDVRLWSYDFGSGGGKRAGFPLLPAYARIRGRDYVVFTDGLQVVAADPARVSSFSPDAGLYWVYPCGDQENADVASASGNPLSDGSLVGVTIDGEHAYVTMRGNPSAGRDPDAPPDIEGLGTIRCFHVPTGRMVWDTGAGGLPERMRRQFDFTERGFSVCAPLVVRDGRVYAGLRAAPGGETESRVLCLDAVTGAPVWSAFLASVAGGWGEPMNPALGRRGSSQVVLVESKGVIHAQTNLGVAAALDASTGRILWLTQYSRQSRRGVSGESGRGSARPACPPVLWKGWVVLLPQDSEEWLVLDRFTGIPVDPPLVPTPDFSWKNATSLVGVANDTLVVGGSPCAAIDLARMKMWSLSPADTSRSGRGALAGCRLYLPSTEVSEPDARASGGLVVVDMSPGVLKRIEQTTWKGPEGGGNLLPAGRYLVVASHTVSIYTDLETLRKRLEVLPVRPAGRLLEHADRLRENLEYVGRAERPEWVEEIVRMYQAFLEAAETEAGWGDNVRRVRGHLCALFLERAETTREDDWAAAADAYAHARAYAEDGVSWAKAVRGQARTLEAGGCWGEAVRAYQDAIQGADEATVREESRELALREVARRRIQDIVGRVPGAYDDIEREAKSFLEKAAPDSFEALRAVMDRYPNSRAAREAGRRAADVLLREGRPLRLPAFYADLRERFGDGFEAASARRALEVLEEIRDTDRLRLEKARLGEPVGADVVGPGLDPAGLRRIGAIDGSDGIVPFPLCPVGVIPPSLGDHLELFSRGSAVELWDLNAWSRVWVLAHPEGHGAALVGTAFTRDYGLVVAWDDLVVSVDPETGKARWTSHPVRDGSRINTLHAVDGRLCIVETLLRRSDGSERCVCLNDSTGKIVWAMEPGEEDASAGQGGRMAVTPYGSYLSDSVVLLSHPGPQTPGAKGSLRVVNAGDGKIVRHEDLQGYPPAVFMDVAGGAFYYVAGDPARRVLRGVSVDGSPASEEPLEIPLAEHLHPPPAACALVVGCGFACLAIPPFQQGADSKIVAFPLESGSTGFPVVLPEGRALPPWPSVTPAIGGDGVLYVYNIPKGASAKGRAYVTALQLVRGEANVLWEGAAPEAGGEREAPGWLLAGGAPAVILATEASSDRGGRALLYDASGQGYLRLDRDGLAALQGRSGERTCPAAAWRGRFYAATQDGLEVFGK